MSRTLGAEELARDVEVLAADDNDLLAVEELLGNNAGKTAEEMALAVNDDLATSMLATRMLPNFQSSTNSISRSGFQRIFVCALCSRLRRRCAIS